MHNVICAPKVYNTPLRLCFKYNLSTLREHKTIQNGGFVRFRVKFRTLLIAFCILLAGCRETF